MATLATIRERVLTKLVDAGGSIAEPTAAQVTAEINAAIDFYEPNMFWFNDAVASGTLSVGSDLINQINKKHTHPIPPNTQSRFRPIQQPPTSQTSNNQNNQSKSNQK